MRIKIAIFGSGSGTNAENIIQYFQKSSSIEVSLVISNKSDAYILKRAENHHVPTAYLSKSQLSQPEILLSLLSDYQIDFIVLAGFLLQIPPFLINKYPNKIVNIHPALLPRFGGKGMYGDRVHESVLNAGEQETGITIHYVDQEYDSGDVIFQATCPVSSSDCVSDIARKVHSLEYLHFPRIIEETILSEFK